MQVDRALIEHLARLSHLHLDPAEVERLEGELRRIIGYVNELKSVDVEGVAPTAGVGGEAAALRADVPRPSLDREAALGGAPARTPEGFRVPHVLGEG